MGLQLAIAVESDRLTIVAARAAAGGLLTVDSVRSIDLPPLGSAESVSAAGAQNGTASSAAEGSSEPTGETSPPTTSQDKVEKGGQTFARLSDIFPDQEIDSIVAVIPSDEVLHHRVSFPFSDPKKVEAVSTLQLQDLVPFDLDGYVIDNLRLSSGDADNFPHLASLVPEEILRATLARLGKVGADPKVISTKPSAVVGMLPFFKSQQIANGALVLLSSTEAAISMLVDGHLYAIRNLSGYLPAQICASSDPTAGAQAVRHLLPHIISTLTSVEKETGKRMTRLLVVGPAGAVRELEASLRIEVQPLDLSRAIARGTDYSGSLDDIAWAAGLIEGQRIITAKSQGGTSEIINFRTGKYAYRRGLVDLLSALSDEFFYICLVILMFAVWLGSSFYTSNRMLSRIDNEIARLISDAVPGESVPYQREVSFVEDKVQDLESQLKGIGSLSSLSPLESLEELSQTISPTIDVQIDSLSIGHSRISIAGSVLDVPTAGRLETALQAKKTEFCDVKVDPRDKLPGSSRIKFNAEIKLCE